MSSKGHRPDGVWLKGGLWRPSDAREIVRETGHSQIQHVTNRQTHQFILVANTALSDTVFATVRYLVPPPRQPHHQRLLLPHDKDLLIIPPVTLGPELEVEIIQHPRQDQAHLHRSQTMR